jgi:hypothetical protein
MRKKSTLYDIPLPSDATRKGSSALEAELFVTRLAGIVPLTAFHKDFMGKTSWTFGPDYSTLDPNVGVSKSLGFSTVQTWCRLTSPIITVIILVGSGDDTDHGQYAEINIQSNQNEASRP